MNTVWKFQMRPHFHQLVPMPEGATLLTVAQQDGDVYLWAMCDSDAPLVERIIITVPTGEPIPEGCKYISTIHLVEGALVFHLFEKLP